MYSRQTDYVVIINLAPPQKTIGVLTCKLVFLVYYVPCNCDLCCVPVINISVKRQCPLHVPSPFVPLPCLL